MLLFFDKSLLLLEAGLHRGTFALMECYYWTIIQ